MVQAFEVSIIDIGIILLRHVISYVVSGQPIFEVAAWLVQGN